MGHRIWDCHWHLWGTESADEVLSAMDGTGIDRISLFGRYAGRSDEAQREAVDHLASVAHAAPDRIYGLPWINPTLPGAEALDWILWRATATTYGEA